MSRMFPPGAPLSPTGLVVMGRCGRRGIIVGPRRDGACTWCGVSVTPPRKSWCGDECVSAYLATQPPQLKRIIWRRDRDRPCEVCGRLGSDLEMDHRVPIIEGGHPFDPQNLRLIHATCHRAETSALASRRSQRRAA